MLGFKLFKRSSHKLSQQQYLAYLASEKPSFAVWSLEPIFLKEGPVSSTLTTEFADIRLVSSTQIARLLTWSKHFMLNCGYRL